MSDLDKSFQAMMLDKNGFGKELYDAVSKVISMPHSYRYGELDKNGVYYALYTVIASRVPDIKSYEAMLNTNNPGGIEKELYLAAQQINAEEEYELIVNKVNDIFNAPNPNVCYPNVTAVKNALNGKADKIHTHNIDNIVDLTEILSNKQEVTHIQNEGESAPTNYKKGDILLFKKDDDSEVISLKICVKNSVGTYQDSDWITIPLGGGESIKAFINNKIVEGSHTGTHYSLPNLYTPDTLPTNPANGDLQIETVEEAGIKHNKLSVFNSELSVWEELLQCHSGGDFSSTLENKLANKQDKLDDSLGGKNTAKIIVNGVPHPIINTKEDITITTGSGGHPYIRVSADEPSISDCALGDIWLQPVFDGAKYHYIIYFLTNTEGEGEEVNIEWVRIEESIDFTKIKHSIPVINGKPVEGDHTGDYYGLGNVIIDVPHANPNNYKVGTVLLNSDESSLLYDINICCKNPDGEGNKWVGIEQMLKLPDLDKTKINNVNIIGKDLTSHDINVPLLKGEVIINRLEPQTILTDIGVLWIDCRRIRERVIEKLAWILTSTPTPEDLHAKTWIQYPHEVRFTSYQGGDPIFPDPALSEVGDLVIDHKPNTAEPDSDIYILDLKKDGTTHYWRKLSSQDGYGKDPTKPSINGVNVAGARTGQSYKLQDLLESGVNIRPVQVGEGEPQSILGSEVLHIPTGGSGTSDYNSLSGLPYLNEKMIKGKMTSTDFGIPVHAEVGNCIIARNESYIPMLNVGTIWLDLFGLMEKRADCAKILDWKGVGSDEKIWVEYGKIVYYIESYDPDFVPHDIEDEQEGDLCVVWNNNLVPVYWKAFKLDLVDGSLVWRRLNVIYSYSQIPDKPILNGHRFAGTQNARYYEIANMFFNKTPGDPMTGDFRVTQFVEEGTTYSRLAMYNQGTHTWEEFVQKKDIITYIRVSADEPSISDCALGDIWLQPVFAGGKYHYIIYFLTNTEEEGKEVNIEWVRIEESLNYTKMKSLSEKIQIIDNALVYTDMELQKKQNKLIDNTKTGGTQNFRTLRVQGETKRLLMADGETDTEIVIPDVGGHNPVIVHETKPDIDAHEIGDLWFKPVVGEHKFEIYTLTETTTGGVTTKYDWELLENQLNYRMIPNLDTTVDSLHDKIAAAETNITNLQGAMSSVESKICTGFDKTSESTSPSCKAVADYMDAVLAGLDGSEEAL